MGVGSTGFITSSVAHGGLVDSITTGLYLSSHGMGRFYEWWDVRSWDGWIDGVGGRPGQVDAYFRWQLAVSKLRFSSE